jgi:hypothetical protein
VLVGLMRSARLRQRFTQPNLQLYNLSRFPIPYSLPPIIKTRY